MRGLLLVVVLAVGCGSESEGEAQKAGTDAGTEASSGGAGGSAGSSSGGSAGVVAGGTGGTAGTGTGGATGGSAGAAGTPADAGIDAQPDAQPDAPFDAGPSACNPPSPSGPSSGGVDCTGTCWPSGPPSGYGVGGPQCEKIQQCGGTGTTVGQNGFEDFSVILPENNEYDGGLACPVACNNQRVYRFNYTLFGGCAKFTTSGDHTFSTSTDGCGPQNACLVTTAVPATVYVYASPNADAGWVRAETSVASSCPFTCP